MVSCSVTVAAGFSKVCPSTNGGRKTGEVMAVLITNESVVPHLKELAQLLRAQIPGFTTLVQNINTRHTNVIMGQKNKVIWGPGFIHDHNGVSLTVCNPTDDTFQVAIIPYTFEHTNFHAFKVGSVVNLEFDIIGKYISRMIQYK